MQRLFELILLAVIASIGPVAAEAAVYPCGTDPGFCYRDIGDDGCFDMGVDVGPINAAIEGSSMFPLVPPPGSLVCPPSVTSLVASASYIRLATPAGSDVLFYAATVDAVNFEVMSGGEILLGNTIFCDRTTDLDAQGDIAIERGLDFRDAFAGWALFVESVAGDVSVGPKARFLDAGTISLMAAGGDISLLSKTRMVLGTADKLSEADLTIEASGDVVLESPAVRARGGSHSEISITGANVTLLGKGKVKQSSMFSPFRFDMIATAGDLLIEKLKLTTDVPVTLSGTNVTIGVPKNGKTPKSKIVERRASNPPVNIVATDTITLDNVDIASSGDVTIDSSGTTVNVLNGQLKGRKATPTITVSAGAGSTCDLSGTLVKSATLVTACDTVIGP